MRDIQTLMTQWHRCLHRMIHPGIHLLRQSHILEGILRLMRRIILHLLVTPMGDLTPMLTTSHHHQFNSHRTRTIRHMILMRLGV